MKLQNVTISYGRNTIIDHISTQLQKQRFTMLLGANGSGKTTLLKAMTQLQSYRGDISIDGVNLQTCSEKRLAKYISYVPQIKMVVDQMRVDDCIVSGITHQLSMFEMPSQKHYDKVDALLEKFSLSHIKNRYLHEISGGEMQMVYVLRALIQEAKWILMDEPCTYLDFARQHAFLSLMQKQCRAGQSILVSIHDPSLAMRYGDTILFLHEGKLFDVIQKEDTHFYERVKQCYEAIYQREFYIANEQYPYLIWKE